jgi:RHS repeat-associated protein
MVLDQTGALANMKRHDYLPFGEELFAPAGGRTTAMGYASGDGVRQQFTLKERDIETGLDYFLARYYSSMQGRFTSVDPIMMEKRRLGDPQEINLYAYTRNNPLKYVDPTGEKYGSSGESVGKNATRE